MTARFDAMGSRVRVPAVRLLLILAALLTIFALGATKASAAPPNFTWTSTLSTTQAGGHPSMGFSYASTSTQSLTRLDIDLPEGLMHKGTMSNACSNPLYKADACPASSNMGSVTAQLVVGRVTLAVPGSIYLHADPNSDADLQLGIILRPPFSSLGLTGKIFLSDAIRFRQGGGLRHSLTGPLSSVTVGGTALVSRVSQLRLQFSAQQSAAAGPLTNNPTSCRTQQFRATGFFSDQSTVAKTSSYVTTGCTAVPFAPTAAVTLDNNVANQRTSFAILLGSGSSTSSLHTSHLQSLSADLSEAGALDLAAIEALPECTDAQLNSVAGCPADSKVGDISADIEGFGARKGEVFSTFSPGHKTVAELTLRTGQKVRFAGNLGGGAGGTIDFAGLPQLPLTSLKIAITKPLLKLNNTCAIRLTRVVQDGFSGSRVLRSPSIPAPDCTPATPVITSGPDRGITINTNHVEYRFTSTDTDVTFECSKDDAPFLACASPFVDDWQGEGVHTFRLRTVRQGHTVSRIASASFSIDTRPPEISSIDPLDDDSDGDGYADKLWQPANFKSPFRLSDAGSGIDESSVTCTLTDPQDPAKLKGRVVVIKDADSLFHCDVSDATSGPVVLTITARDAVGNTATVMRKFIVDAAPPSIAIDEPGAHYSPSPAVSIPITIADDSLFYPQGEVTVECERKGWDGTIKGSAKIITDRDSGRSKGFCVFENVPEGSYKVTVRGWDPTKKEELAETDLVVDTTPPAISIDEPGVHFTADSFFDVFTILEVIEANPGTSECSTGDLDGDGLDDFVPCSKGVPVQEGKKGLNAVNVKLADRAGNVGGADVLVFFDQNAPSVDLGGMNPLYGGGGGGGAGGFFDFTVDDDSLDADGPLSVNCELARKGWDGTIKGSGKLTKADAGRAMQGQCAFGALEDGEYEVTVTATDAAGRSSAPATRTWIIDRIPPEVAFAVSDPANRVIYSRPSDSISVQFDSLTSIPTSYECVVRARDPLKGHVKGHVTLIKRTTQGDQGVCDVDGIGDLDGSTLEITATDAAGNSGSDAVIVVVDSSPPTIELTNPDDADADGDEFADKRFRPAFFDVFFELADVGGGIDESATSCLARVKNGGVVKGSITISNGNRACSLGDLPDGDVEVEITTRDATAWMTLIKRRFTVDTTPPSIAIDEPGAHIIGDPDFDLLFTATDGGSGIDESKLECSLTDDQGQQRAKGIITNIGTGGSGKFACAVTGAPEGDWIVVVSAADYRGHVTVLKHAARVDLTDPVASFEDIGDLDSDGDGFADNRRRPADFEVVFNAGDGATDPDALKIECSLTNEASGQRARGIITKKPGGGTTTGRFACQLTNSEPGDSQLEISVTDGGGHVTVLKNRLTVTGTTAPETTIDSGPVDTTRSSTNDVAFSSSDADATFRCKLDTGAEADCVSPQTNTLPDGVHKFCVYSIDRAGNKDDSPACSTFAVSTTHPWVDLTARSRPGVGLQITLRSESPLMRTAPCDQAPGVVCIDQIVTSPIPGQYCTPQFSTQGDTTTVPPGGIVPPGGPVTYYRCVPYVTYDATSYRCSLDQGAEVNCSAGNPTTGSPGYYWPSLTPGDHFVCAAAYDASGNRGSLTCATTHL